MTSPIIGARLSPLLALMVAAVSAAAQVRPIETAIFDSAPTPLALPAAGAPTAASALPAVAPLPVLGSVLAPSVSAAAAAFPAAAPSVVAPGLAAAADDAGPPPAAASAPASDARASRAEQVVADETASWGAPTTSGAAPLIALAAPAPQAPRPGAAPPAARRRPPSSASRDARVFDRSAFAGLLAAVPAGVFLNAMTPQVALYYAVPLALVGLVGALGLVQLGRALAARAPTAAAPRRVPTAARAAAGVLLGAALTLSTVQFERPIVEKLSSVATPQSPLRAVPGSALRDAAIERLSSNPVGRGVLARLTDRFGVVHMPPFFVQMKSDGSVADYNGMLDAVLIGADEIAARGWTVERFLRDPALQRLYVADAELTFAHELTHAGQVRGSPFEAGQWGKANANFEAEYEAYLTEHFYLDAKMRADPRSLTQLEFGQYVSALDQGVDVYLDFHVTPLGYPNDVHVKSPSYDAYIAKVRAAWPAHVVAGYVLAARRSADRPKVAASYLRRARSYAAAHGLPAPEEP